MNNHVSALFVVSNSRLTNWIINLQVQVAKFHSVAMKQESM